MAAAAIAWARTRVRPCRRRSLDEVALVKDRTQANREKVREIRINQGLADKVMRDTFGTDPG